MKPSLFKNELLATSDAIYAWVFQGLWCIADRSGRLEDRPRRIHLEVNAGRAYETTEQALAWLAENGFIVRYQHGACRYIQITNFAKHQNPHVREPKSTIPAPGEHSASTVLAPGEHSSGPALSPFPLPDSPSPIPEDRSVEQGSTGGAEEAEVSERSSPVERIFEHWRGEYRHPKAVLDAKRRKAIAAALKAYSEADLCAAISGYKNSPHHMGQNDSRTVYDSIELFLRDASHIDRGLALASGGLNGNASPEQIQREIAQGKRDAKGNPMMFGGKPVEWQ